MRFSSERSKFSSERPKFSSEIDFFKIRALRASEEKRFSLEVGRHSVNVGLYKDSTLQERQFSEEVEAVQ